MKRTHIHARTGNRSKATLDLLSVSSTAAYSLRKLRSAYSGSAIRVRRSSDNAELDIGFTAGGDLNTTALLAHCAAGNGFVTTWYDQSTNGYNTIQTTAVNQPQIVTSGAVITQNGKPAVSFDGTDDVFTGTIPSLTAHSINLVTTSTASGSDLGLLTYSANTVNQGITHHLGATLYSYFSTGGVNISSALALNTPAVITRTWDGTANINNADLYAQGVASATKTGTPADTNATTTLTIGRAASFATQKMQELTVFSSAISGTDRQTLERNQGAYFGITVA